MSQEFKRMRSCFLLEDVYCLSTAFFFLSLSVSQLTQNNSFLPPNIFFKKHIISTSVILRHCCVGTSNCFVCSHYFFLNIFCFCSKLLPYFSMTSWYYENGAISYSCFCYYNKLFTYG